MPATVWQYVYDLATSDGYDLSVVPPLFHEMIVGLLIPSEIVGNNELVSVSLGTKDSKNCIHLKVKIRVPLRDARQISPQMNPILFARNTTVAAAVSILTSGMVRPSNFMIADTTWLPSRGFYTRAHNYSRTIAMEQAGKFGGWQSPRPICITGVAPTRQLNHVTLDSGGVKADCVASQFIDMARARDKRWCIRASNACNKGFAIFW